MEALTGNLGMIICFVVGSGLILLEAFMPEFGAAGIAGIILEILGIVITSRLYGTGWALLATFLALLLVGTAIFLSYRSFAKGRLAKSNLVLDKEEIPAPNEASALKEWIGKDAVAESSLRPAGFVLVDGNRLSASTAAGFLEKGTAVEIIGAEGDHLIVRKK